jgi:hypothetical protein
MSEDPTFAELFFYHCPTSEGLRGDTILNPENQSTLRPGPYTSKLDSYHYRLLKQHPNCDQDQLEKAWQEWLRLGEYKNGETQRSNLYYWYYSRGKYRELYAEIQKGLRGTIDEQEEFNTRWVKRAREEIKQDGSEWETWWEIVNSGTTEETQDVKYIREPQCHLYPNRHADDWLGRRIYR